MIAPYQHLTSITTMDDEVYNLTLPLAEINATINDPKTRFLAIWSDLLIPIHQIKKIKAYDPTDIEFFILSLPLAIRTQVQARTEKMKGLHKKRESIDQIYRRCESKGIEIKF